MGDKKSFHHLTTKTRQNSFTARLWELGGHSRPSRYVQCLVTNEEFFLILGLPHGETIPEDPRQSVRNSPFYAHCWGCTKKESLHKGSFSLEESLESDSSQVSKFSTNCRKWSDSFVFAHCGDSLESLDFLFWISQIRRRTNVQQLTCKIDLSSSFYYVFFSFVLLELKPFVFKWKVLGEKFWKILKKCQKVWESVKMMKRFCPLVVAL